MTFVNHRKKPLRYKAAVFKTPPTTTTKKAPERVLKYLAEKYWLTSK